MCVCVCVPIGVCVHLVGGGAVTIWVCVYIGVCVSIWVCVNLIGCVCVHLGVCPSVGVSICAIIINTEVHLVNWFQSELIQMFLWWGGWGGGLGLKD